PTPSSRASRSRPPRGRTRRRTASRHPCGSAPPIRLSRRRAARSSSTTLRAGRTTSSSTASTLGAGATSGRAPTRWAPASAARGLSFHPVESRSARVTTRRRSQSRDGGNCPGGRRSVPRGVTRGAVIFAALLLARAATAGTAPVPIPEGPEANSVPSFIGAPAVPHRIVAPLIPQHPFMAPNGRSNIHDDAYMTDTYVGSGPLGRTPERRSTYQNAECGSLTFDSTGRIVTICVGVEGPRLVLIDAQTL